jgi:hypothetical protein
MRHLTLVSSKNCSNKSRSSNGAPIVLLDSIETARYPVLSVFYAVIVGPVSPFSPVAPFSPRGPGTPFSPRAP